MTPRTPRWIVTLTSAALALTVAAGCDPNAVATGGDGSGTSTGGAGNTPTSAAAAEKQLKALKVAKPGSMSGYSREKFPHWKSTGKNCDTRDSVLKRDGTNVKLSGCNVVAGSWVSIYDGKKLTNPIQADIDHVVPLANAWRSGAAAWTTDQREAFANDLDDPQLVAVSSGSNRSKGDQDPSTWKPPAQDNWCKYATDWVAVKTHWKLTVTSAEVTALDSMLGKC